MKKGYGVQTSFDFESNCILVQNAIVENIVKNYHMILTETIKYIDYQSVLGVWKIKNKN